MKPKANTTVQIFKKSTCTRIGKQFCDAGPVPTLDQILGILHMGTHHFEAG